MRFIYIGRRKNSKNTADEELTTKKLQMHIERFQKLQQEGLPIHIVFGEVRGGDIPKSIDFAELIMESRVPVFAHIHGNIASAGIYPYVACKKVGKRIISSRSRITFHSWNIRLDVGEIDLKSGGKLSPSVLRILTDYKKRARKILSECTDLSAKNISTLLSLASGIWAEFNSLQTIQTGLTDKVRLEPD